MRKRKRSRWFYLRKALWLLLIIPIYLILTCSIPYTDSHQISISSETINQYPVSTFYATDKSTDRVKLLSNLEDDYVMRLALINDAKETIDVSIFQIMDDEAGNYFISALCKAASKGVKIRMIFDDTSSKLKENNELFGELLSYDNVSIKGYGKINVFKPETIVSAMHDKYMIVDSKLVLLGGRNIENRFFDMGDEGLRLAYDRDVLVYATNEDKSVVKDISNYFNNMYNAKKYLTTYQTKESEERVKDLVNDNFTYLQKNYPDAYQEHNYYELTKPVNKITFVHNPINWGMKEPTCYYVLDMLMNEAKDSVYMQTPYIILNDSLERTIDDVVSKGIDLDILTNSYASTPNILAFGAYLSNRDQLVMKNLKLYEYQSNDSIHGKAYIIDNRISVVGSFNYDPRSMNIDNETMLVIDSQAFATELKADMDSYKKNSLEAGLSNTNVYSAEVVKYEPSNGKRFIEYLTSFGIRPFKHLT